MLFSFSCLPSYTMWCSYFSAVLTIDFLLVLLAAQPHMEGGQLLYLYTVLVTKAPSLEHGKGGIYKLISQQGLLLHQCDISLARRGFPEWARALLDSEEKSSV